MWSRQSDDHPSWTINVCHHTRSSCYPPWRRVTGMDKDLPLSDQRWNCVSRCWMSECLDGNLSPPNGSIWLISSWEAHFTMDVQRLHRDELMKSQSLIPDRCDSDSRSSSSSSQISFFPRPMNLPEHEKKHSMFPKSLSLTAAPFSLQMKKLRAWQGAWQTMAAGMLRLI